MLNINTRNRIDFVLIIDVANGNPNGDPAALNKPRTDPFDNHGLITDTCVKRKVRDYLQNMHNLPLFINRDGVYLNALIAACAEPEKHGKKAKVSGEQMAQVKRARAARLCEKYIDVRLFGAMAETSDYPAGRIRGPVQLAFARSTHQIRVTGHQVTRCAVAREEDELKIGTMSGETGRYVIDYAVYKMAGSYTPAGHDGGTGCTDKDLNLFFEALLRCWAQDRASARGTMGVRGIYVAMHETRDGRCHAGELIDAVTIEAPKGGPRSWADVQVTVKGGQRGVTWAEFREKSDGSCGLVAA